MAPLCQLCPDHGDTLSDHTLNNQPHITALSPLFQQNTYVSHRSAGRLQRDPDPSRYPMACDHAETKRRWSWIMGDIVYIYTSVHPEYRNWAWCLRAVA
ncbi:hypothetical protein N7491_006356 [Penicillium cf. griseofulvum]|uniref:Uncharacterized protein n=1 Tax=Penicillium cf. griseofulvum TaxID=2972120 RepID=A0A9W9IZP5_9EURO|nr:hypothetical protein N7472_010615 [Penicillium cf. griseofulvum]KAJ5429340.1 hypothetical protein N7491_006356 [Penicillium cf. griseofulvum]KAJ5436881.1 hypothetical protein N7445_007766 [Penicillium cf. griseofulvum]